MRAEGTVRFKINGLNIEKLINNLIRENIPLKDVRRNGHREAEFSVSCLLRQKVIAILEKMCYNYRITEEKGFLPFAFFLKKRFALIIGFLIFAALSAAAPYFVSDIRVTGCIVIDKNEIVSGINNEGVKSMSFGRVSADKLQKTLYNKFKDAAFVSVYYRGTVLYVSIVENEPVPQIISTEPRDIVCGADGVITKVLVFQGTALVKAGDRVVKGQVLIGGYRLSGDGTQIPVRAMGEVSGSFTFVYTEKFEGVSTQLVRNGVFSKEEYIETLGVKFPVAKAKAFNSFETETSYTYLFKNNFLPSRLVTITYFQTELAVIREDWEKVKKVILEEAERKAREEASKSGEILSVETAVKDGGGEVKNIEIKVHIEKSFTDTGDINN